jgi:hypothetical protein
MAALLKRSHPFSTFAQVCNDVQLKEIELLSKTGSYSMTLVATTVAVGRTLLPTALVSPSPLTASSAHSGLKEIQQQQQGLKPAQ